MPLLPRSALMKANQWTRPSNLVALGAHFSSTSPAHKVRQAALGLISAIYQLWSGGRTAELLRWRWHNTAVTLADGTQVPVWAVGAAGLLPALQQASGTGCWLLRWHCKYIQGTKDPEAIPVLPRSVSGLCLPACLQLAWVTLTWLQPTSPDRLVSRLVKGAALRSSFNECGFVYPYGGLQYVTEEELASSSGAARSSRVDSLAPLVRAAAAATCFLNQAWDDMAAAGEFVIAQTAQPRQSDMLCCAPLPCLLCRDRAVWVSFKLAAQRHS
jgi:hypothetical protein